MRIGIDLGGTKIEGILLDAEGVIRKRLRVPTPQADDRYTQTLQTVSDLVDQLEAEANIKSGDCLPVGIGTPGSLSPATGLLRNSNSVCLNDQPLKQDLESALARPVRLANDADCFALSEATDGAAKDAAICFGAILGTGVGGGLVIDKKLLSGTNAIAGEWGHNPFPVPELLQQAPPVCYCGRVGCIETILSGPALESAYHKRTNQSLSCQAIAALAEDGNSEAKDLLDWYAECLACALGTVINLVDPDVVVLGGGVSNISYLYEQVPAKWNRYIFSDRITTRLLAATYGDSSGVRGAAWLWP